MGLPSGHVATIPHILHTLSTPPAQVYSRAVGTIDKRIRQDGKPSYRARIRRRGHPLLVETFRRKVDAEAWIRQTEQAIRQGLYVADESRRRTFGDLVERYVGEGCPTLQPRRGELAPKEVERRAAHLAWWAQRLGAYFLVTVTLPVVEDEMRRLATEGGLSGEPAGPATRNRYLASLSAVLSYGVRIRWLSEHPLKGRIARAVEPEPNTSIFRRLEDVDDPAAAEWPRIKEACQRSRDRRLYPALLVAAVSGARPSELWEMQKVKTKPLRWDHLDLRRGVGRLPATKAGPPRLLLIEGAALDTLREYARVRPLGAVYVFESSRGSARFPRKAWAAAQAEAGIELAWHRLRHTAASWALMSGSVSLAAIGAYHGHGSPVTTKRYAHLVEEGARGIAKAIAESL